MENSKQQIEEMAKVIRPILESRTDIGYIPDLDKPIAKELFKHYQPKLPEDAVVLTREEYEKMKTERQNLIDKYNQTDEAVDYWCEKFKNTRKKTAKEIITMIKDYYGDLNIIARIAKQYGVEIE